MGFPVAPRKLAVGYLQMSQGSGELGRCGPLQHCLARSIPASPEASRKWLVWALVPADGAPVPPRHRLPGQKRWHSAFPGFPVTPWTASGEEGLAAELGERPAAYLSLGNWRLVIARCQTPTTGSPGPSSHQLLGRAAPEAGPHPVAQGSFLLLSLLCMTRS